MITSIQHDPHWLTIGFDDGTTRRYPTLWLRDNIPSGRHRAEGQRLFDINSLPADMTITNAAINNGGVRVVFSEGTSDIFPAQYLQAHTLSGAHEGDVLPSPSLWGSERQQLIEFAGYEELLSHDAARLEWLRHLRDYGYALLGNTPAEEKTVIKVVDLFGFVRETNYGALFDVIVWPDPANLANTSARIGMHTDNPYRDPVPGLQLLHCIVNESDGGESQLCDGFAVAERLRAEDQAAFELLASYPVRFRYLDAGNADLQHYGPLIEMGTRGNVEGIRYNSRSVAAFDMPAEVLPDFYRAYRRFAELLHEPQALIEFRLEPEQLMVFDNQRVLHGRSEYTIGHRHLQGCYADKDALHSTIRVLEAG
jgi:gamma-butyrobetaine dioxygenase